MKGTWLGQAGFLFTADDGTTVMVDPYMSDSLLKKEGTAFTRQVPIRQDFIQTPDILALTHCHEDHMDLETLDQLFGHKRMTVLAPANVLPVLRQRYAGKAEFVLFTPGTEVTLGCWHFRAVFAAHSDREAVGIVLDCDSKRVYHMGDSLYHRQIFADPVADIDLLIIPINGKGNNMNAVDAVRMTRDLAPAAVLPMHWDLFKAFGCDVKEFTSRISSADGVEIRIPNHYEYFTI